ncbi:MAG: hypothetical protein R8G01_09695 [Ilumatobacteraceae bacterium]|nr:hypothetical protein [Ilumatobacteraceae bacterium]
MTSRRTLLIPMLSLLLVATACGGDDDTELGDPLAGATDEQTGDVVDDTSSDSNGDSSSDPADESGASDTSAPAATVGTTVSFDSQNALDLAVLAGDVVIGVVGSNDDRRVVAVDPATGDLAGELAIAAYTSDQFDNVHHIVASDEIAVILVSSDFGESTTLVASVPDLALIGDHPGRSLSNGVTLADGIAASTADTVTVFDPSTGAPLRELTVDGTLVAGSEAFLLTDSFDGLVAYDPETGEASGPFATDVLARPEYALDDTTLSYWSNNGCSIRFIDATEGPSASDVDLRINDDCNVHSAAVVDGVAVVPAPGLTGASATAFIDVATGSILGEIDDSFSAVARVGSMVIGVDSDRTVLIDPAAGSVVGEAPVPGRGVVAIDDTSAYVLSFGTITRVTLDDF